MHYRFPDLRAPADLKIEVKREELEKMSVKQLNLELLKAVLRNRNRNWNRWNRIILTQEEPEPYPCSRFQF